MPISYLSSLINLGEGESKPLFPHLQNGQKQHLFYKGADGVKTNSMGQKHTFLVLAWEPSG